MTDKEFGKLIASIFEGMEVQEKVSDDLSNEISRNSEILQEHRVEINEIKKKLALVEGATFDNDDKIMKLDRAIGENNREIEDMRKDIDLLLQQNIINNSVKELQEVELNNLLYERLKQGYLELENKFEKLRELFEKQVNIAYQVYKGGAIPGRVFDRFNKVREEYEELMEG